MSGKSDVCLILEGTYPYVSGGVSTWVHQLITSLRDIKFSLLVILPNQDYMREIKYKIPENVVDIKQVFIHDHNITKSRKIRLNKNSAFSEIENFIIEAVSGDIGRFDKIRRFFYKDNRVINQHDLIYSKYGWNLVRNIYKYFNLNISFIDFFWTYRFTVLPLTQVLQADIPKAGLYHTISTGYAGLLGVVAKLKHNCGLVLTEHGIYTKERRIEITQASWIYNEIAKDSRPNEQSGFFKKWWINLFDIMSRICYKHSSEIITLFEENQKAQLKGGAEHSKLSIIPNGIDLKNFCPIERKIEVNQLKFVVGFVGRVVPIKDVKTFIKACKIISQYIPQAEFPVIGPTDEDEDYYQECVLLRDMLGLEKKIVFTGKVNVIDYYKKIDLLVLTSESEAQPLVILEGNAVGIPVVASDVGACMELLEGRGEDDRQLGLSGIVTGVSNPEDTAGAVIKILRSPELYASMSVAGIKRVRAFYNQSDLLAKYLNLYEKYLYR